MSWIRDMLLHNSYATQHTRYSMEYLLPFQFQYSSEKYVDRHIYVWRRKTNKYLKTCVMDGLIFIMRTAYNIL